MRTLTGGDDERGYLLASVLMLTTAMTILSFAVFDAASNSRNSLERELYKRMANDAAQSGIEFAYDQVASTPGYTGTNAPTDCNNSNNTLAPYLINAGGVCSTFKVEETADGKFVSTGYVYRAGSGANLGLVQQQYVAHIDAALAAAPGGGGGGGPLTRTEVLYADTGGNSEFGSGAYTPSSTFTPTGGSLLIANVLVDEGCYSNYTFTSGATEVTFSGGGLTWTALTGRARTSDDAPCDTAVRTFYAIVPSTPPSNMTVTADTTGGRIWAYTIYINQYTNYNTTTPITGAASSGRSAASGATWALSLPDTPAQCDVVMGVAGIQAQDIGDSNSSGFGMRAGWTQYKATTATPAYSVTSQLIGRTGTTAATVEWRYANPLWDEPQDTVYSGYIIKHDGSTTNCGGGSSGPVSGDNGAWLSTNAPLAREGISGLVHNGYMYMIGGCNSSMNNTNTVYYAPINANGTVGTWTATTVLPFSTCHQAATIYNGRLYVQGGEIGYANTAYATLNANGTVGSWSTSSSSTQSWLAGHAMVAHNGWMYYLAGTWDNAAYDNYNVYRRPIDPSTGALGGVTAQIDWFVPQVTAEGQDGGMYCATAFVTGNKIVIQSPWRIRVATINGDGSLGTPSYESLPPVTGGRSECAGFLMATNNKVYYWGGAHNSSVSDTGYRADIDPVTGDIGAWTALNTEPMIGPRTAGALLFNNGYLYYMNGSSTAVHSNALSNLWYSPLQP
ncbi:hypothetical protein JNJ66_05275 [Candidatus Saccharibacteria bacterium]|nr:hypothetical protein [Candidatus Saccharibacteria bacterium]